MFAAGQSIGNYRILSKLGTGGMGAVYLAEHPLIGKKVALKVIHRELAGNREVVQRFFQEARAVNQIGNEHIVEIHDFGVTPEGDHFYIMEYLDGPTLAAVLAHDKVLPVMRALHVGAQIASALQAAHSAGVIHRDLKPDNVMLTHRLGDPDFVKVLDFGLAKMFASGGSAVKTAAGVLLGTPQYMSPEACESRRDLDHRTDVYALGVLLFQMMTGVLPFDGQSMGEILVKQVTTLPPAPRGINPAIPPSVEQLVLRCLAKPVASRFPSMAALREALLDPEAYLRGSPPIAPARSVAPGEAPADAKTVMAHAAAREAGAAREPGPRPPPMLAPPVEPSNNTMQIGTPLGYSSSAPPRRMWPIVLVLGLVLGLGGGAFAVAWFGRGDGERVAAADAEAAAGTADAAEDVEEAVDAAPVARRAADATATPDAATPDAAAPAAPDAAPVRVTLTIDSRPRNASVYGPGGRLLGKTRLELRVAGLARAGRVELRLPGYRRKTKRIVVEGNMTIGLELERLPAIRRGDKGRGGPGKGGLDDDGLIRPGD